LICLTWPRRDGFKIVMVRLPDLSSLSRDQKDALIAALWAQVQALRAQVEILAPEVTRLRSRVAELEAKLG
jgi:hypothetical protein